MELVLIVLTAPSGNAEAAVDRQILTDVVWANARSADGLEHVTVGIRPGSGSLVVGIFLIPDAADATTHALRLCQRAVRTAPVLSGWTAAPLSHSSQASENTRI